MASLIANARIDGEAVPEHETNGYYIIIATAGHDTTSSSVAGGLLALIEHPDQMEKLRGDPDRHMPNAINEVVRWVTPVRHFMRTATADCRVAGTDIAAGESCIPLVSIGEPRFGRVRRSVPPSAWIGPVSGTWRSDSAHTPAWGSTWPGWRCRRCSGNSCAGWDHVELNGEPRYSQSTFVGGLKSLPIRYRMK